MVSDIHWGVAHGADGSSDVSTNDVLVVTVVLGESLLNDGDPEGSSLTSDGVFTESGEVSVSVLVQGEEVIDNDSDGHAESIEVDGVDSVSVDIIVEEHLLDGAWDLSHSGGGGKEPTVTELTLLDVVRVDTVGSEQASAGEGF